MLKSPLLHCLLLNTMNYKVKVAMNMLYTLSLKY